MHARDLEAAYGNQVAISTGETDGLHLSVHVIVAPTLIAIVPVRLGAEV
jgi:hypothetical protein